jgi:hypothetical protein
VRGLVGVEKEGGVRQCGDRHSFISGAGWSEGGGGSGAGATHGGERGGVRHGRGAQRGRGPVEQKTGRGGDSDVRAAREAEDRGGMRGPRMQSWADRGREELGRAGPG